MTLPLNDKFKPAYVKIGKLDEVWVELIMSTRVWEMGSSFWECNSIADILFVLKLEQIINTLDYTTWSHVVAASDYHLSKEMVSYFSDDNFQGCDHIWILLAF